MNNLCELDSKLTELRLAHEKASVICSDLKEDYFGKRNPDGWLLQTYYDTSGTKAQILVDYLYEMRKSIEALQKFVNEEFENVNCKTA